MAATKTERKETAGSKKASVGIVVQKEQPQKPKSLSPKTKEKKKIGFKLSIILLGLANMALIVSIFVVLNDLRSGAQELRELRGIGVEGLSSQEIAALEKEIATTKESVERLSKHFTDDESLVNYVKETDRLKRDGTVVNFSFATNDVVRDKTGNPGWPVALTFEGSWQDVDRDLRIIQGLPHFQRAIEIEINRLEEGRVNLRYGGILYAKEEKNR